MAIGDAYATVPEYKARERKSVNRDDTQIIHDLKAVSRYIDRVTGYTSTGFEKDTSDATRYITIPDGNRYQDILRVPPLSAAPTSVALDTDRDGSFGDESALNLTQPTGDVLFLPENHDLGPEARPITSLKLTAWSNSDFDHWPAGKLVRIIGKFGWPAVPEAIRSATIELTAILRLESPRATETVSNIDETLRTSNDAQKILNGLTRTYRDVGVLI